MANDINLPSAGFDCNNDNYKFEFLFDRSKDMDNPKVYRRINGKFIEIGNLLAEKQGAYVIWEDKDFFRTTDFAWTFDKVTSKLSSMVLSVGLGIEKLDKIPKPMTCMQKIFYY
jgi:spore coat protein CotH